MTKASGVTVGDSARNRYREKRMAHWDQVARRREDPHRPSAYYCQLLQHYYRFLIPRGLQVLELGCRHGDLLAGLEPSVGVGIDFSEEMLQAAKINHPDLHFLLADVNEFELAEKFDVIILSDLVNDLWDVQGVLEKVRNLCHPGTRLVLNFLQ